MRGNEQRLFDMMEAAARILEFTEGMSFDDLMADEKTRYAVRACLEDIGEASRKVSDDFKLAHPEIPWAQITGTRHKLAHDYFRIDWKIVWDIRTDQLADLISKIERILPPPQAKFKFPGRGVD